jgi:hypothetical protein
MEPKHYLDLKKEDILSNLTIDNSYTEAEAKVILQDLYFFVGKLKTERRSETLTDETLRLLEGYPDRDRHLIEVWLFKAIQYDDSYVFAYTPLAQEFNCKSLKEYQMKDIAYNELIRLIESEDSGQNISVKSEIDHSKPLSDSNKFNAESSADQLIAPDEQQMAINYSDLLNALSKYIAGVNPAEFANIIKYHSLTPGTPKARWIGKPVDAHRFATIAKMKIPVFNKCFSFSNERKLKHNDRDKSGIEDDFAKLLFRYFTS